ncbi:hypothetical protein RJ639_022580 [Escallonia herrerae]|uniref:Uncharacterized protein n=1 Tax=Escallonia herrerae TaxID=1293975 RepID=A0AA89AFE1_9ASTE|nr:hypothetical protein RJ639_022580 [Escallonia herrerae]
MEIKILSRETVKPSTPTPHYLRNFKLSVFDQLAPPFYVPITFFYPNNADLLNNTAQTLAHLKKSLSQTLTRYYPLAGRIKDSVSVDCNDKGVSYTEALVNCKLSSFLRQPDLNFLNNFISCQSNCLQDHAEYLVALQVTVFECGGIVIGSGILHKLCDGMTMSAFFNCWGETARGLDKVVKLDLTTGSILFPARDSLPPKISSFITDLIFQETTQCLMRRFVFGPQAIAALKAKATSTDIPNPSRVEVLTAFICKLMVAAAKTLTGITSTSMVTHAIDMRRRIKPPLPRDSFGNLIWLGVGFCSPSEKELELHELVEIIRDIFRSLDSNDIGALQGNEGFALLTEIIKEGGNVRAQKVNTYKFTSWCNMGFYDVDFGWGKPVWVGYMGDILGTRGKREIVLLETRSGDGVEVWFVSDELELAILENDPEFLAYVSSNPYVPLH